MNDETQSFSQRKLGRAEGEPKVSVVIPPRTRPSIVHRFWRPWIATYEVILVDGDSSDNNVEVARRHFPDITIVRQTRKGKVVNLVYGTRYTDLCYGYNALVSRPPSRSSKAPSATAVRRRASCRPLTYMIDRDEPGTGRTLRRGDGGQFGGPPARSAWRRPPPTRNRCWPLRGDWGRAR